MALASGARLGPYEVVSPLGAGGMGEVYRARDTRLDRTVAIKILPVGLTADPQFRDRFDREARVISQLEHPHICALYDVGSEQGNAYLVMQYLEGETIAERLTRGPLPVDQAVRHAIEIAGALEKAHRAGIVHRDLKPANVMLTKNGAKLLDFGLAKAAARSSAGITEMSMLPTTPALGGAQGGNLTVQGTILGTFQYMAPEQLEGLEADARTDIFAFGALLYEMLSGKKAFEGKSQASLISSIMSGEPAPVSMLQPLVPPALDRIIRTCLAKDPDERWQSAGDIERQLRWTTDASSSSIAPPMSARPAKRRWVMPAALTAAFVVGAMMAAVGAWLLAGRGERAQIQRLSIVLPAATTISFGQVPASTLAISPDGTAVVYSARPPNGPINANRLLLRTMDAVVPREIEGTQGARQPFFSPDGRWIGFFTLEGSLKKVSLAGGTPITVVEKINAAQWAFGAWTDAGEIVYGATEGLTRVSADGGPVRPLTTLNAGEGEADHGLPEVIPGRGVVLFSVRYSSSQSSRIDAVVLATGERRTVLDNAHNAHVLDGGYLLFQRGDAVLVAPFDFERLALTGPAVPLVDDIRRDGATSDGPTAQLAVSRNGTLAFVPASDTASTLVLVTRDGKSEPLGVAGDRYDRISASPDGRQIAASVTRGPESQVHVYDLQRGSMSNLTQEGSEGDSAWRNSRQLVVSSQRRDVQGLVLKDLGGTEQLLIRRPPGTFTRNAGWSPDGSMLAYTVQDGSHHDIWTLTMGEQEAKPLLTTPASEHSPRFSPNGRWLAYVSDESGRQEIYIRRYPQGDRFVVSTQGGTGPVWARHGREIYFQSQHEGEAKMMAVAIHEKGDTLDLGTPTPLFPMRALGPDGIFMQYASSSNGGLRYDVLPDGRFVMVRGPDSRSAREIVLVQHWLDEVRRLTAQ